LTDRVGLASDLHQIRAGIQDEAAEAVAAPIHRVKKRTKKLKDELVICGYLSEQEAARLRDPGNDV
jgi:polyhydroxyalkanoate synthesis regulator phasin